jgi:DNA-binding NtrC family response regulator
MDPPHSSVVLLVKVSPESDHLCTLKSILEQAGVQVLTTEIALTQPGHDPDCLARFATEHRPSAIILFLDQRTLAADVPPWGFLGSALVDVPIIVAAQDLEATQIRTLLEQGVRDFVLPPFTSASVLPRVWRVVKHSRLFSSIRGSLREKLGLQRLDLLGESPSFLAEIRKLPLVARCDVTVMIVGETGTGKELIARAVHYLSPRYDRPFVPIDCGAIPPELAESELFGHERGAFTGAVTRTPGLISAAEQGTLFLDEVDALSLSVQAKFLRFLQQMEYRPLGSNKLKKADVRVILATNSDLQQRVRNGEFREDLFYRLNVAQIRLPALRQRREDVVLLAKHFAAKYCARFKRPALEISQGALQRMLLHQWPGNIRELENVVEAAVAMCDGPVIRESDLLLAAQEADAPVSFREAKARTINEFEREYIVRVLYAYGGNVSEAARAAGKNRRAFWELMRKHGVKGGELKDSFSSAEDRKLTARSARAGARNFSSG